VSDEWRAYIGSKDGADKSNGEKERAEQKRDGSIVITNDNRQIYPHAPNEDSKKPSWVEKGTLLVLTLTLLAAGYAGYEANRLAELTRIAVSDAESTGAQQAADTAAALKISRDAAEAAKKSADAALTQAGEMHEQAATSKNQLAAFQSEAHIRLRAYLAAIIINGVPALEVNKQRDITITFQAAGQTPAIDLTGWAASAVGPFPMPESLVLPSKESVNPGLMQTKTTLTPGTITTLPLTAAPLDQPTVDTIKGSQTHRLYIWGKMDFSDVFGCKRWITYCMTVNDTVSPSRGETCPRQNDMEGPADECPR
jgi:hypothetical protein